MKKINFLCVVLFAASILWGNCAAAQTARKQEQLDNDSNLLRRDLRAEKKQFVAANLSLTEAEAGKFWSIYDQYEAELRRIYDKRISLIKEYTSKSEYLTDAKAAVYCKRALDNEEEVARLRQKYLPLIVNVLPGTKTALFFQIEKRLGLLIDLQIASEIPLLIEDPNEPEKKNSERQTGLQLRGKK